MACKSNLSRMKRFIANFEDVLTTDGSVVFCRVCMKSIHVHKRQHVIQHVTGKAHSENLKSSSAKKERQTLVTAVSLKEGLDKFKFDLCKALVSANIPWKALSNPVLRRFLESNMGRQIPHESTLRKLYLKACHEEVRLSIPLYTIYGDQ